MRGHFLRAAAGSAGGAAFPEPSNVVLATQNTSTSHAISFPSGLEAGDELYIAAAYRRTTAVSITVTAPSGFTQIATHAAGSRGEMRIWKRTATGSDGSSATPTTDVDCLSATACWYVRGAVNGAEISSVTGAIDPLDPPSLSPSWGAAQNLYVAVSAFCFDSGGAAVTAAPSGFDGLEQTLVTNSTSAGVAVAFLESSAGSENPGVFTISSNPTRSLNATVAVG